MDFDFSSEEPKKETHTGFGFTDHSPNSPQGIGMSLSDDFEHISGDKLLDTDYDLLGSSMINAPAANQSGSGDKQNILDGFSFTEPKQSDFDYDSSPKFGSPAHQKASTIDFMHAERNQPPPLPKDVPVKTNVPPVTSSSWLEDIEDDYLNSFAAKKTVEPVKPPSNVWDKDSDDEYGGKRTPSPDPFVQPRKVVQPVLAEPSAPVTAPSAPVLTPAPVPTPVQVQAPIQPPIQAPTQAPPPVPVSVPSKPLEPSPVKPVEVPKKEEKPKVEEVKPITKPQPVARANPSTSTGLTTAEEIFCKLGLDAWFKPDRLHPKVESLIYWRDVKKSGAVFGSGLVILLAISFFSVISVVAYLSLLVLAGTVAFRVYKTVLQAVQKTNDGHPFKDYLEIELVLPQEKVQQVASVSVAHVNAFLAELRRLFLVEDLVDSIKFGLLLWVLTYLGSWFNGITLVVLAYIALFTLPKVYENNKQSIDVYLDLVRSKITEVSDKVKAAIPIGKKQESDKDK